MSTQLTESFPASARDEETKLLAEASLAEFHQPFYCQVDSRHKPDFNEYYLEWYMKNKMPTPGPDKGLLCSYNGNTGNYEINKCEVKRLANQDRISELEYRQGEYEKLLALHEKMYLAKKAETGFVSYEEFIDLSPNQRATHLLMLKMNYQTLENCIAAKRVHYRQLEPEYSDYNLQCSDYEMALLAYGGVEANSRDSFRTRSTQEECGLEFQTKSLIHQILASPQPTKVKTLFAITCSLDPREKAGIKQKLAEKGIDLALPQPIVYSSVAGGRNPAGDKSAPIVDKPSTDTVRPKSPPR